MFTPKENGTLSLTGNPTSAKGMEFLFDKSAYADDVALAFGSREDIETGSPENATHQIVTRRGTIPFTDKFKYLGSLIAGAHTQDFAPSSKIRQSAPEPRN
mmetsp:Transcript_49715/g.60114  ORF Transcript_49715/g.60114 Transcript_49715/m.60114 type:complete len:101 (+) Transcript_49715:53-355(+)